MNSAVSVLEMEARALDQKRKRLIANQALAQAIRNGLLAPANNFPCVDCGKKWVDGDVDRHEWHHHLGYEVEHHLDVIALCRWCHLARHGRDGGKFRSLDADGRRAYFTEARRRSRARAKAATEAGAIPGNEGNIREALADAALMILAVGAPGADLVRNVLAKVFAQRPGVPLLVETKAKRGKLKPKLIARSE